MSHVSNRRRAGLIALCSVVAVGGVVAPDASAAKKKKPTVITSKQIKNGTIQSKDLAKSVRTKIDAGARALKVIANGSVGTAQLADNSITSAKLANLAVTTAKLAEGSVTSGKLADGSVTNPKLGEGSVTTGKLADGSVTNPKLGNASVNSTKIAPNAVGSSELADSTVTSDKIGANGGETVNLPNIPVGTCVTDDSIDTDNTLSGDILLVTPDENLPIGVTFRAAPVSSIGQNIRLIACNVSAGAINPGDVVFSWTVLEN